MDDFSVNGLNESKNEWCARLLNVLTPTIVQGVKSIFDEALKLCQDNKEVDKYLMTFQNFLTRVPKWNQTIIDTEKTRIVETSGCTYLEDLITCVHIIQLKVLTSVRVGSKQKKIDINVPSISDFIHKIYIHVARKLYTNIYLFERNIPPLQTQKNTREIELIIKECILNTIRDSIPVESILRAYMDETEEQDVEINEVEELIPEEIKSSSTDASTANTTANANTNTTANVNTSTAATGGAVNTSNETAVVANTTTGSAAAAVIEEFKQTSNFNSMNKLSFSENDTVIDVKGTNTFANSIKDDDNSEESKSQTLSDDDDDEDEDERLTIGGDVTLDIIDINDLNKATSVVDLKPPELDFEILT
jgi:hypothetical protein